MNKMLFVILNSYEIFYQTINPFYVDIIVHNIISIKINPKSEGRDICFCLDKTCNMYIVHGTQITTLICLTLYYVYFKNTMNVAIETNVTMKINGMLQCQGMNMIAKNASKIIRYIVCQT